MCRPIPWDDGLPKLKETSRTSCCSSRSKDLGDNLYGDSLPCDLHDGSYLPIYAVMDLNSRGLGDLSDVNLMDTIIHETLHALEVGTLWEPDERISLSGDSDDKSFIRKSGKQVFYTAPRAVAAYQKLGGKGSSIPLDPHAGHWAGGAVCSEILSGDAGDFTDRVNPYQSHDPGGAGRPVVHRQSGRRRPLRPADQRLRRAKRSGTTAPKTATKAPTQEVYYANCAAVRAAGMAPLKRGQPGYRTRLDGDGDGLACE